ncbi:MAG: endonuclease, partial [Bacilli bacterium]
MKKHINFYLFFLLSSMTLMSCDIPFPSASSSAITSASSSLSVSESSLSSATITSLVSSTSSVSSIEASSSVSSASSESISSNNVASSSSTSSNVPVFTFTIASNAPAYYQNINPQLTGEALKQALDLLISTNVNVSYDWFRFESADESMTETNKVLTIYPRRNYLKTAHVSGNTANTWNREHTYPQSKISGAAVNDNHHIYADDWKTNSTRGNFKFGIVSKSESTRVRDSSNTVTDNYVGGGFFEPNDAAKGEVARATLYMNTYYGYTLTDNFQTA